MAVTAQAEAVPTEILLLPQKFYWTLCPYTAPLSPFLLWKSVMLQLDFFSQGYKQTLHNDCDTVGTLAKCLNSLDNLRNFQQTSISSFSPPPRKKKSV